MNPMASPVASPAPQRRLVGLVGPPGVGKSTLAERLAATDPGAAVLPMDGFHLPQERLRQLGRRERMGAPDTFDVDAFVSVLRDVRNSDMYINGAPEAPSHPSRIGGRLGSAASALP